MSCLPFRFQGQKYSSPSFLALCWILTFELSSSVPFTIASEPSIDRPGDDIKAVTLSAWHEMIRPVIIVPQIQIQDNLNTAATAASASHNITPSSSTTQHEITIVTALYEIGRAAYDGTTSAYTRLTYTPVIMPYTTYYGHTPLIPYTNMLTK